MDFRQAFEALKDGNAIKRKHWSGYWKMETNNGKTTINMYCKNGEIVPFEQSDIKFSIENICEDDWEVIDNDKLCPPYELALHTFTFGEAIRKLKNGKRVARIGWNGKGMYLWLMPAATIKADWCKEPHLKQLAETNGGEIEALGSIRMLTADKKILTGWLASQTDILSEDWVEV